jgi:undecaprenyl-diphosphatase
MMTIEQLLVLAIVQGITEFLPVSSSAHLILLPQLMNLPDQGALIDIAIHIGSLFAVIIYFWRDVISVLTGSLQLLCFKDSEEARLARWLIVATIPILIVGGILFLTGIYEQLRSAELIAWTTLIFGLALYIADRFGSLERTVSDLTYATAFTVGLAQCFSLLAGTSRSGVTITAARVLGFSRVESARFSMLLAVPTIAAFGLAAGLKISETGDWLFQKDALIAAGLSFVSALITITLFMRLLTRISLTPFVIYRLILGLALLAYVYVG